MSQSPDDVDLGTALAALRAALVEVRLPLDLPPAAASRREVTRLVAHLDDYLLPRVRQLGAPLLAVVGGSTGAGKSTLVNALVGAPVSAAGVLRPTTRSPVLVHHPDDTAWFTTDRVLPGLARWSGSGSGSVSRGRVAPADDDAHSLRLVAHPAVPRGLALLDAPDIDSVVTANRELGAQLLGAADLWVFVTTAARYADAVPWDLLAEAAARRAVVALVLDRVEPVARDAVTAHLGAMLAERGLADARLFAVPEVALVDGLLPREAVAELDRWLHAVVGDAETRDRVVQRTVHGAVTDLVRRTPALAGAADDQLEHAEGLRSVVRGSYQQARGEIAAATSDGTMLRGEVLARWQEYVGTGEMLRAIETTVSTWRDRVSAALRGRPAPEPVTAAIGHGLVDVVHDAADGAAERVDAAWRADPVGAALLDGVRLARSSLDLRERAADQVRGWQAGVLDLVRSEGAGRRSTARALSLGVNGLGAALMVTIFAHTGGLTAAEVGVAGGTVLVAQRLLEAVFGDEAVRRLTRTAQADLDLRVGRLLEPEQARWTALIDALDLPRGGRELRAATAGVARAVGEAPPVLELPGDLPDDPSATAGAPVRRPWWRRWQG
ncbi:MAG TPA: dynamin family protein [Actinotalea sp.]|nr:dynamin family protein [Actinotalea sp.]